MEQCQCLTKEGSGPRCTRQIGEGKEFCWQHVNCKFPIPKPPLPSIPEEPIVKLVNVPPKKIVPKKVIKRFDRIPTKDLEFLNKLEWDMQLSPADYRPQNGYYNVEIFDNRSKKYRGFTEDEVAFFEHVNSNLQRVRVENPMNLEYELNKLLLKEKYDKFLTLPNEDGISLLDIFLEIYEEVKRVTTLIYQDFSKAEFNHLFFRGFIEKEDKDGVYYEYVR